MSHFAKLDSNNVVTTVIKSEQDVINSGRIGDSFLWVQTSYNGNFRGRFAQIGGTYDKVNEVFIDAKPFASWTPDWENDKVYLVRNWNDAKQKWEL